jgi:hypothetical protein
MFGRPKEGISREEEGPLSKVKLNEVVLKDVERLLKEAEPVIWMSEDGQEALLGPLSPTNNDFYLKMYLSSDGPEKATSDLMLGKVNVDGREYRVFADVTDLLKKNAGLLLQSLQP